VTPQQFQAFTLTANGRLRELVTECYICAAPDPAVVPQGQQLPYKKFQAIWDTGATNTLISQEVVDACGLKPIGITTLRAVGSEKRTNTFLVNILLRNNTAAQNVQVALGDLGNSQVLIGMDIITVGDFAITNVGGKTVFSFRIPSTKTIDFVKSQPKPRGPSGFRPGPPAKKSRKTRRRKGLTNTGF